MKRGNNRMRKTKMRRRIIGAACAVLMVNFGLFLGISMGNAEDGAKAVDTKVQTVSAENALEAELSGVDVEFLDAAPEDVLCIGVLPTETGGVMKYFVPEAAVQKALYDRISSLDVTKLKSVDIPPEWVRDAWDYNVTVKYGEYSLNVCEGGVMRIDRMSRDYTAFDEWYAKDENTADYIMGVVAETVGIVPFDAASVAGITKAELMTGPMYAGEAREGIVLTDPEKLAGLEKMLSGAEKSFWSQCPFGQCALVLTTGSGEQIRLAMACDSCTVFYANGCFYNYMPEEYRGSDGEHPCNNIFFDLFGVSAEDFLG